MEKIQKIIRSALSEDIGAGDVTSKWICPKNLTIKGVILAKEDGVLAGLEVVKQIFAEVDKKIIFVIKIKDGSIIHKGQEIAEIKGRAISILSAERTALNFLQRMSGIATLTHKVVEKIKETKTIILDTRKTAPGLRLFDKWAVRLGGGQNHRFGLFDMVLIKDNHIQSAGGVTHAIKLVKKKNIKNLKIEVEVNNLNQLVEALKEKVDVIMLDNMNLADIKKAVKIVDGKTKLEISGGVNLDNVLQFARTGVDFISIGALTHSAKALDISLEIE